MPDDKTSEIELIEKAANGDEDACQKILNIYKGRIFNYIYRLVKNYDDAEEITFEVFIKCFRSLKSFDISKPFSTWLFTIAHNLVIDFFRKCKVEYEYLDERGGNFDQNIEHFERTKKRLEIERALMQLPPIDREIVLLFHKEGYSYEEISEILKLPVSTIKIRLHRARKRLHSILSLK